MAQFQPMNSLCFELFKKHLPTILTATNRKLWEVQRYCAVVSDGSPRLAQGLVPVKRFVY